MLQHHFTIMGGPARIFLQHGDRKLLDRALSSILHELDRIEKKFSFYLDSSLLSLINNSAGTGRKIKIDEEFSSLLNFADVLFSQSGGSFDPTAGVLRDIWNFDETKLPDEKQLTKRLKYVGWQNFKWSNNYALLPSKGMRIDLGGLVKEYAVDFAVKIIRDLEISSALVDLAGDIGLVGDKPNGSRWKISIRHPRKANASVTVLKLSDVSIATSGDYERGFILDQQRYSHLINPKTGWPVKGLVSSTVISEQCLIAGGTATTSLLKEGSDGPKWLKQVGLPHLAIDNSMNIHTNLQNHFSKVDMDKGF